MKDFVALDVETANERFSSICSIGAMKVVDGRAAGDFYSLIDPRTEFSAMNSFIHGITSSDVEGAPTFEQILHSLNEFVGDLIVVHHTHFDRTAIGQASELHGISTPGWLWLDSAKVTRRAWPQLAKSGYGLANVCEMIGYEFDHHNALEDARACGEVILAAAQEHPEIDLLEMSTWALSWREADAGRRATLPESSGEGPLVGETTVFTGQLSMVRKDALAIAASLGSEVADNVTKKTTLLVVGDQDVAKLAGHKKSSKHRKAEQLIRKGQSIRILAETDFLAFVASEQSA